MGVRVGDMVTVRRYVITEGVSELGQVWTGTLSEIGQHEGTSPCCLVVDGQVLALGRQPAGRGVTTVTEVKRAG